MAATVRSRSTRRHRSCDSNASTPRSIVPTDPALALIDAIIEDFGDEWVTKAMYHYRWAYQDGIDKAGTLPLSGNLQLDSDGAQMYYDFFTQRQIGRRELVGSTDITQPIIDPPMSGCSI